MICREAPHLIMDEVSDPTFFHLNQNTLSRQLLIFIFQAMEERNEQEVDILIHDRTPVDILAYTFLVNPDYEHSVEGRLLSSAVHRWLSRYDIVFRTPIEFPMPLDGTRDPDLSFQRRVQEKIDELYRTFRCDPITVRGSVEERVKQVENTLANFGPAQPTSPVVQISSSE